MFNIKEDIILVCEALQNIEQKAGGFNHPDECSFLKKVMISKIFRTNYK